MTRKLNTKLLFIDTDSLCYELHEKNLFDLNNFSVSIKCYFSNNKKYSVKRKMNMGEN